MTHADECRSHYQRNKKYYLDRNIRIRIARREIILGLRSLPCVDCDKPYPPCVMEFDHVPERGPRRFTIGSQTSYSCGRFVFEAEIAKCDVICANCHRIRTHVRGQQHGKMVQAVRIERTCAEGQSFAGIPATHT